MGLRWGLGVACAWLATAGLASAVTVTDFGVYAQGSVRVQDAVVGDVGSLSGSVQVKGKGSVRGDVSARADVLVSSGAAVIGGANAGGAVRTSGSGSITGSARSGLSNAELAAVLTSDLLPTHAFSSGGASYKAKGSPLALAPGSYGAVSAKGAGTLCLSAGDYYFDSLSAKGTKLMLDVSSGPISLYVSGNMALGKSDVFVKDGAGGYIGYGEADSDLAGLVYAEVHGGAKLSGTEWFGTIYTPDGLLQANKSVITGALYSGADLRLKGNGHTLVYSPLLGAQGGPGDGDPGDGDPGDGHPGDGDPGIGPLAAVPEPATLALLGTALFALAAGRRRLR